MAGAGGLSVAFFELLPASAGTWVVSSGLVKLDGLKVVRPLRCVV